MGDEISLGHHGWLYFKEIVVSRCVEFGNTMLNRENTANVEFRD